MTQDAARHEVHLLRASVDAVIVGTNTVYQDNPHLTSHHVDVHNPLRVVMSRSLNLPNEAHLWDVAEAPTVVFTIRGSNPDLQKRLVKKGVELVEFDTLTPAKVMEDLYNRELLSVLWECGGTLAAPAIADGAVQKILAFIAPKIIGGQGAPSPVGDLGLTSMGKALTLDRVQWRTVGSDCLVEGYLPS